MPTIPTPVRTLVVAILWCLAANLASALGCAAVGFAGALYRAIAHVPTSRATEQSLLGVTAILCIQLCLLLAARRQARRLDPTRPGHVMADRSVRRRKAALLLCLIQPPLLLLWVFWMNARFNPPHPGFANIVHRVGAQEALQLAALSVALAVLAPICEEVFFRGWLWTALHRNWPHWAAGLASTLLWLALHLPEGGPVRVLYLLPTAAMLALMRVLSGSIRATIALHVVNNLTALAILSSALRFSFL